MIVWKCVSFLVSWSFWKNHVHCWFCSDLYHLDRISLQLFKKRALTIGIHFLCPLLSYLHGWDCWWKHSHDINSRMFRYMFIDMGHRWKHLDTNHTQYCYNSSQKHWLYFWAVLREDEFSYLLKNQLKQHVAWKISSSISEAWLSIKEKIIDAVFNRKKYFRIKENLFIAVIEMMQWQSLGCMKRQLENSYQSIVTNIAFLGCNVMHLLQRRKFLTLTHQWNIIL